jgi:hypothetical protein
MAVLQAHHRSHNDNTFDPFRRHPPSYVYQSIITDQALKRDILGPYSIDWSTLCLSRDSPSVNLFTDHGVLGSWPRLQGLRGVCPSDASSFNVRRNNWDLCDPPDYDACWTCTPTASAFVWGLEDALPTSIYSLTVNTRGLTHKYNHTGMGMACIGNRSRGAYSGK